MLGVFVLVYGLETLGWGVIGQGALDGRLDAGWLTAWALLVLSLIPLQLLGHWLDPTFALETGRILKQRLLAGALGWIWSRFRHQGAGQLLWRVIESQSLESLALNGGLTVLIACVELAFAAWILVSGAGGRFHLLVLLGWVAITVWLSWRRLLGQAGAMPHHSLDQIMRHVKTREGTAPQPPEIACLTAHEPSNTLPLDEKGF